MEKRSEHHDDLANTNLIPSVLPNYIPPLADAMSHDNVPRDFDYTVVITEISFANGYKNPTSSNSYEVTHGTKLPQKHFQKVQNYTTNYKIRMHHDYTGSMHTCAIKKRRKSAHAHNV